MPATDRDRKREALGLTEQGLRDLEYRRALARIERKLLASGYNFERAALRCQEPRP